MLLKACNRCGKFIPYGVTHCQECAPIVEREREERMREAKLEGNKRYNQKRDPKYVRFYNGWAWRALSARYAQDKGYRCEKCGAMATQVHHIKAIQTDEGWELRLAYTNLELLCTDCHNKVHNRFSKCKRRKQGRYGFK